MRSMAPARLASGNLPMSSAETASTTPVASRLMFRDFCSEPRRPVTMTSWTVLGPDGDDEDGSGAAPVLDIAARANVDAPPWSGTSDVDAAALGAAESACARQGAASAARVSIEAPPKKTM